MELAVSFFAVFLSVLSLGWQAFTWSRSGPKPSIEGRILQASGERATLEVRVNNAGRSAFQITELMIASTSNSSRLMLPTYGVQEELTLPHQLDSGQGLKIDLDASRISASLHHHQGLGMEYVIRMVLGDGTFRDSSGTLSFVNALRTGDVDRTEHITTTKRVLGNTEKTKKKSKPKT